MIIDQLVPPATGRIYGPLLGGMDFAQLSLGKYKKDARPSYSWHLRELANDEVII